MRAYTRRAVTIACVVIVTVPLYWMTVMMSSDKSGDSVLEDRILDLRNRLQKAENQNLMRENELKILRDQFAYMRQCKSNRLVNDSGLAATRDAHVSFETFQRINANSSLYVPSILTYLPYLRNNPNSLRPAFSLSRQRSGVSMVFGVPTVKREKVSYLISTLRHLVDGLDDQDDSLIIVFVAEPHDMNYVQSIAKDIENNLREAVQSGLIEVISPPESYYPDFKQLRITFNDTPNRVRWRTKQNLDFAFLMLYAKTKGTYYTQLEDDIIAKPQYSLVMKNFVTSQGSDDWLLLEFSQLGFIGKMFKTRDLPMIVDFFIMFHNDKPVDWLLDHVLSTKYCHPEKTVQHCRKVIAQYRLRYKPSLFQHVGIQSSLKGKVQKLKDKDFGKSDTTLLKSHKNPPADLRTSLTVYQKYTIDRAYIGESIFWALNPEPDDTVEFHFKQPFKIRRFLFRTGNPEHPGDKFVNTTVEVLPKTHINDIGSIIENRVGYQLLPDGGKGFLVVGRFDLSGICQGTVDARLGEIAALRLHVLRKSPSWVIISEILIEPER